MVIHKPKLSRKGWLRFFIKKMNIYSILEYQDPQALQDLHNFNKAKYGFGLSKPHLKENPVNYDPYAGFDTEEADKEMRKRPQKLRRPK